MARLSETGGRASKAKARRASHAKGRKTAKTSPNDKRRRNAGRETEVARLKRELKEALARQTATSEILHVISQSPTDVRPVFDAIVLTAMRLFRCDLSFVMLCDHTNFWVAAAATPEGLFDDLTLVKEPIDPSANFPSRAIVEKQLLYLPDWSLIDLPEHERQIHERIGVNSGCLGRVDMTLPLRLSSDPLHSPDIHRGGTLSKLLHRDIFRRIPECVDGFHRRKLEHDHRPPIRLAL
jgi:hypothetical protein